MTHTCADGQFMDRLLLKCVSCNLRCHEPQPHKRCSEYCVAWRCRAVSGQFYDALLKKCLRCSDLCGTHTPACEHICSNPVSVTGGGRTVSGSPLLLYALLGVCVTVLMFSLSAAVLMLLMRRNKHTQTTDEHKQQTSEDSLMPGSDEVSQEEGSVHHHHHPQDRPRATETCVYCFSEHTARPHTLLQQAGDQDPESVPIPQDKCGALRIICSPSQTSL
ncbi:tumor necrosis factor receptor superfamily member 13B [Danio aesculapii]|uniref:tumor necrosis factor receptor superfamily member 13B n=1 Tax=Danio aesculapii TaxID=1142201 RepID=UPI0024BF486C|nr:tumor necrosis factor receptor superfamily member 13B [Danio aesculapii]